MQDWGGWNGYSLCGRTKHIFKRLQFRGGHYCGGWLGLWDTGGSICQCYIDIQRFHSCNWSRHRDWDSGTGPWWNTGHDVYVPNQGWLLWWFRGLAASPIRRLVLHSIIQTCQGRDTLCQGIPPLACKVISCVAEGLSHLGTHSCRQEAHEEPLGRQRNAGPV